MKPTGNSTSSGTRGMIARGKAARVSKAAVLRISTARSWRSDNQPSGHCTSRPARMQLPMNRPTCSVGRPWAVA
ncbi:hypothetical protein D3C80_1635360 [compost metagenome]